MISYNSTVSLVVSMGRFSLVIETIARVMLERYSCVAVWTLASRKKLWVDRDLCVGQISVSKNQQA